MTSGLWDTSSSGEEVSARRLGTKQNNERDKYPWAHIGTHTHTQAQHGREWARGEGQTPSHHGNDITGTAHTQAQHGREWARGEGQTPSHRGNDITGTDVGLTSTSSAKAL